jgi:hypothetical protein
LITALLCFTSPVSADGGWYLGASTGQSSVDAFLRADFAGLRFNERTTGWKGFGGYIIDLPLLDFGVEGGYVDFGGASTELAGGLKHGSMCQD